MSACPPSSRPRPPACPAARPPSLVWSAMAPPPAGYRASSNWEQETKRRVRGVACCRVEAHSSRRRLKREGEAQLGLLARRLYIARAAVRRFVAEGFARACLLSVSCFHGPLTSSFHFNPVFFLLFLSRPINRSPFILITLPLFWNEKLQKQHISSADQTFIRILKMFSNILKCFGFILKCLNFFDFFWKHLEKFRTICNGIWNKTLEHLKLF